MGAREPLPPLPQLWAILRYPPSLAPMHLSTAFVEALCLISLTKIRLLDILQS